MSTTSSTSGETPPKTTVINNAVIREFFLIVMDIDILTFFAVDVERKLIDWFQLNIGTDYDENVRGFATTRGRMKVILEHGIEAIKPPTDDRERDQDAGNSWFNILDHCGDFPRSMRKGISACLETFADDEKGLYLRAQKQLLVKLLSLTYYHNRLREPSEYSMLYEELKALNLVAPVPGVNDVWPNTCKIRLTSAVSAIADDGNID